MGAPVAAAAADQRQVVKKIPVPTNYRNAVKYVRLAVEQRQHVNEQIGQDNHFRCGRTLVGRVLSNLPVIDALYAELDLATKEPRLDRFMARVLIAELLFGSGRLVGNSRPVECVQQYAEQLQKALTTVEANMPAAGQIKEPRFVRLNTSVLNVEGSRRLLQEEQWILVEEQFADYRAFLERVKTLADDEYLEDFHFADLLVFPHSAKTFWSRATHLHGQFVLQNKACLLPTYLLKPSKKSVVLDMCAAPGLKTTHLACLMKNKGRIYAVERNAQRYQTLCQYAADHGVIKTMQRDCLDLTDELVPGVEFILLDPSCSGSGMLKRQQIPEPMDEARVYKLAGLQYKLLSHAMNSFPHARRIVYSTCSLYEQENEGVVQGVLRHNGHFRLLDARKEFGKEWPNVGNEEAYPGIGSRCLYARTEDDLTIGMFVAVFERCPEGAENEVYLAHEKQKNSYERVAQRYGAEGHDQAVEPKKAKGKKKRAAAEVPEQPEQSEQLEQTEARADEEVVQKKRKKKDKQQAETEEAEVPEQPEQTEAEASEVPEQPEAVVVEEVVQKKRKKKSKEQMEAEATEVPEQPEQLEQTEAPTGPVEEVVQKKRKKKDKQQAEGDATEVPEQSEQPEHTEVEAVDSSTKEKKRKKKDKQHAEAEATEVPDQPEQPEQMEAEAMEEVVQKKRKKKDKQQAEAAEVPEQPEQTEVQEVEAVVQKKRKKKDKQQVEVEAAEVLEQSEQPEAGAVEEVVPKKRKKKSKQLVEAEVEA